jgi:NAD(P)-dependent dehydrogenase (short-subunit alcohol dehydrogenase family)
MDPFWQRVAVITGGASGIGLAMARAFGARGARLVLADIDELALGRVERELTAGGTEVLAVPTDVSSLASVQALAEAARGRFGAVHIICNNAGVMTFGEIAQATHRDWEFTMGVNFWGVVHGVETFVPILIEQQAGGYILNTSSMAGLVGMQWLGVYSASKFAIVGLTEALFRELLPHGIGVGVLCPMVVETNITENSVRLRPGHLRNERDTPSVAAGALAGGIVTAEEVARRAVRGVESRSLYILTHPEQREMLRRRSARLDAAFQEDGQ